MQERKPIPTPDQAHDLAVVALDFNNAAGLSTWPSEHIKNANGVLSTGASTGYEISLEYEDYALSNRDDKSTQLRETIASIRKDKQGDFTAHLKRKASTASVQRLGYGEHEFSADNAEKAAALITTLAAKRLARSTSRTADRQVQRITDAKDSYAKRMAEIEQPKDTDAQNEVA